MGERRLITLEVKSLDSDIGPAFLHKVGMVGTTRYSLALSAVEDGCQEIPGRPGDSLPRWYGRQDQIDRAYERISSVREYDSVWAKTVERLD